MRSPLHIPLVRYSCRGRVHELYCNFASVHTGLIPSSYQRRLNSSGLMRRNQQFQKLAAISLKVIKRRWYQRNFSGKISCPIDTEIDVLEGGSSENVNKLGRTRRKALDEYILETLIEE